MSQKQENIEVQPDRDKPKPIWEMSPEELEGQLDQMSSEQRDAVGKAANAAMRSLLEFKERIDEITSSGITRDRVPYSAPVHATPDYMAIAHHRLVADAQHTLSLQTIQRITAELNKRKQIGTGR